MRYSIAIYSIFYFSMRMRLHFLSPARRGRGILVTFLATWGCASDFLKMLPKLKMAARGQL